MTTLKLDTLSDRIKAHKNALVHIVKPPVCTERAQHYTEMYQQHLDKPIPVRRALALAHHLANRTIWIKHDELIIGNQASEVRAAPIFPEYTVSWIEKEIDDLADRPGAGFAVSEENKRVLHEVCPWWRGQTVQDRCYGMFTDEQKGLLATGIIKAEGNMTSGDAHLAVNFPLLLEKGLDGLREKVAERRSRINLTVLEDLHGEQFLKAIDIVLVAVSEHIERFAALAREMAATETRESRRDELLTMAENCDLIAHQPPQTFWQALQLCYFIQLILQIESNGHSVSFGRMDQYLYPYYRRDVELNQTLDREHAIEMLHSCWLKLLEVNKIRSGSHSKASAGSPLYQNVTIGGQNLVDGQPMDAVNPLSYAILESCGRLRSTQPNLSVRYHAGMSNDFLDACVQVIRCGFGMPAFNNDEIVIPEFIKLGIEPQDAYDYAAIGCIETAVGGKWGYRCTGMSFINFARVMLAALEGGHDATSGKVFLPQEKALSAGNFNNFDEVMDAWDTQIRYYTRKSIEIEYVVDTMLEENVHDILCSALVDDCIERAKSIKQGGAKYDWVSGLQVGIANLGNSLAAVKKLVFEQGAIGQQQLAAALADDFDGLTHEQLRQRLINGAPKYGNDDDTVDTLLARAYQTYIDELKQYHNPRYGRGPVGGNYYAGTSSISANVPFGAQTMATPDGRKAHTPLAEGASPASGTDHLGPTAVIGSVGKLPTAAILGGVLLNQKLNPATLENESDKQKLMILLRILTFIRNIICALRHIVITLLRFHFRARSTPMSVKVIVTDMDGTFLNDAKTYNQPRFMAQYQELKKRGIEFVVASGNQYYQLISFFPELKDEISFVAENGALVYEHGKQLFHGELTRHESRIVIGELLKDKQLNFVACGLQSAYVSENAPEAFVALMAKHYHRLKPVKDYQEIDDVLFKFSLNLPDEQIPLVIDKLHVALDGIMKPVTSGFGFIDLIIPGLHKANGISRLLKRWDLSPQNVVAIGDSGNDAEMLKMARYSFAMGNAAENIKQIARYATDDNNHEGALNVIQAVLDNTSPFNS